MLKRKSRFAMIVAILLMLTFTVETSLASAATLSQIRNNIKNKQQELNESRAKEKSLGDQVNSLEQQISSQISMNWRPPSAKHRLSWKPWRRNWQLLKKK